MKVRQLIDILGKFDLDDPVRLSFTQGGGVVELCDALRVVDLAEGPLIQAMVDLRGIQIYVGCTVPPPIKSTEAGRPIDLGRYKSVEMAAQVRDFYIFHKKMGEPLAFPDFDYERWVPPRMVDGNYHPLIAQILREKLLQE
jgi:hypothetical protein